jgi:purine-nucleoside phosphorylase
MTADGSTRAEGILTVEMEASCLFTVARTVGVPAAAAFVVSDVLHGEQREPHFGSPERSIRGPQPRAHRGNRT